MRFPRVFIGWKGYLKVKLKISGSLRLFCYGLAESCLHGVLICSIGCFHRRAVFCRNRGQAGKAGGEPLVQVVRQAVKDRDEHEAQGGGDDKAADNDDGHRGAEGGAAATCKDGGQHTGGHGDGGHNDGAGAFGSRLVNRPCARRAVAACLDE